jgi:soluble cytochrome b562
MPQLIAVTLLCLISLAGLSTARAATTPLEQSMKRMATAYHALDKDLKSPDETKKADYVALAAKMKTEVQTSRTLVPKKVAAMPQDQQAAQITDFQKSLDDLSVTIDTLTTDLQASKWDAAKADIAKIKVQEDDGHKKFRVKKHDEPAAAPAPAAP